MKRLLENQLIFGNLLTVEEPHLIERYNKALTGFGLKPTKLEQFSIDMTGFSPEIAHELGDQEYLDPKGVNRRFIILTPAQAELPVVHTQFSNTEELMLEFFEKNKREIFALSIKDVLYGEIEEQVLTVDNIDDLLAIEQVEFKLATASDILGKTAELQAMIDRLQKDPDAWQDDAMLKKMVSLARITGDIRTNELLPKEVIFRHRAFWTAHFGGVYVFNDEKYITVIADPAAKGFRRSRPWEVSYLDINDHERVYAFLLESGRIDPPRGSWIERSGLLAERMQLLIMRLIAEHGGAQDLGALSAGQIDSWVQQHARTIERDGALALFRKVQRQARNWSNIDLDEVRPDQRFLISRANPEHEDWWLTNRLISEYVPFDFLTLFVFNKQGFYAAYERWPDHYRDYVVKTIRDTYFPDKRGFRERLYG